MKKPTWIIDKERAKRAEAAETVWLFGIHAVRDALLNPNREKLRLILTKNAADRLAEAVAESGVTPEISDPRKFAAPIDPQSVHQGAALEVKALNWGPLDELCDVTGETAPRVILLDRVTDPHNVGAILRSAEVFGARAVIAPRRHSAPETGALAKTASGALERQPYVRVQNLARTLVLGAEGPGLRSLTRENCDLIVRIDFAGGFGSLNVSNAAAVALYATGNQ
jgi:23S rRNA (guanosine2251-2'-O)-methyltransferase